MNCQQIDLILDAGPLETLASGARQAVEHHFASCQTCREGWAVYREIADAPIPRMPPHLYARIAAAVAGRDAGEARRSRAWIGIGAVLLVGGALGATALMQIVERAPEPVQMTEPAPKQANELTVVTPVSVAPSGASEANAADVPQPSAASDDGMAALVRRLADRSYRRLGPQFIEYLVSKGLSREDSERAVADIMPDWVRCQLDATLAQAEEQSLSRAAVLAVLDANGVFAAPAQMDMNAALVRAQPCRFSVQQRIGIFPGGDFGFRMDAGQ
jgi:hypothetical protein